VALVQSDMEWIFPVHMKENEKICEITTVYAPVTEKYIPYYFEPAPAVKFWNSV
jgi:hypothetical protein